MKKENEPAKVRLETLAGKIDSATFAAVCAMKGWAAGKAVTEREFDQAVKQFQDAPAGRSRRG